MSLWGAWQMNWGEAAWHRCSTAFFEGVADVAHYQMKMFLGSRHVRIQTSLSVALEDMDTTHGNVKNLKAEAKTLIQAHKAEMRTVCGILQEGGVWSGDEDK